MFWIQVPYQMYDLQIFFPFCGLSFHSLIVSFKEQKFLILIKSTTYYKDTVIMELWYWYQHK